MVLRGPFCDVRGSLKGSDADNICTNSVFGADWYVGVRDLDEAFPPARHG